MKSKLTYCILTIMLILSGCSALTFSNEGTEKTQVKNDHLLTENAKLLSELNELKTNVDTLKNRNEKIENQLNKLNDEKRSVEKRMWSAQGRLLFRDVKDILGTSYSIFPEPSIENDWLYISKGDIQISLSGYKDAQKVKFKVIFLFSEPDPYIFYVDENSNDGWTYKGSLFKSKEEDFKFNGGYVLFASITDKEGHEIITEKLPFYFSNKN